MRCLHPLILLGAVLIMTASGCVSSTTMRPAPDSSPRNIPAEVSKEFERSVAGWNRDDLNAFVGIYDDGATCAVTDRFLQGSAAIRAHYAPRFQPGVDRGSLSFDEFHVEVLAPDLVLVRAIYRNTQKGEVHRGTTTLVMRYLVSRWRIIHDHST